MEESDHIWHWCRARKIIFPMSKIQGAGIFSAAKIGTLVNHVPHSNIPKGKQRMDPVQNLNPEVDYVKNRDSSQSQILVMADNESSSGINSDTISDHPHRDSGLGGQFLRPPMSFAGEYSDDLIVYQKLQPSRFRVKRKGQKLALKQSGLLSGEGMKGSSDQYIARNRETLMDSSSSCSISKVVVKNMQLQPLNRNGEIRNLRTFVRSETSSSYINCPCHPPASKKPKRYQSLISEAGERLQEIENPVAKSEILFLELHLLAEVSTLVLQNEQAALPENIRGEKENRKAIFTPTGVTFLQKRRLRRAKSASKHGQPDAPKMLHNLQGNLSAANAKSLLTVDSISILKTHVCTEYSENQVIGNGDKEDQMAIPQLRCSKRTRSHALPSKYCDSVMQPWKRGTRL